jgi:hypothetical protein
MRTLSRILVSFAIEGMGTEREYKQKLVSTGHHAAFRALDQVLKTR